MLKQEIIEKDIDIEVIFSFEKLILHSSNWNIHLVTPNELMLILVDILLNSDNNGQNAIVELKENIVINFNNTINFVIHDYNLFSKHNQFITTISCLMFCLKFINAETYLNLLIKLLTQDETIISSSDYLKCCSLQELIYNEIYSENSIENISSNSEDGHLDTNISKFAESYNLTQGDLKMKECSNFNRFTEEHDYDFENIPQTTKLSRDNSIQNFTKSNIDAENSYFGSNMSTLNSEYKNSTELNSCIFKRASRTKNRLSVKIEKKFKYRKYKNKQKVYSRTKNHNVDNIHSNHLVQNQINFPIKKIKKSKRTFVTTKGNNVILAKFNY